MQQAQVAASIDTKGKDGILRHPMVGCVGLAEIIAGSNPQGEPGASPPYLQTRALLEALRSLGFEACLWNAIAEDTNADRLQVVAGVQMEGVVLDWSGNDPRIGIQNYPDFSRFTLGEGSTIDRIPAKRAQACAAHPEVFLLVKSYLDQAWLDKTTGQPDRAAARERL